MRTEVDKRLSIREAAKIIYGVRRATPEQMERVQAHIASGELAGDRRGTTTAHVADYLARVALLRQREARRDAPEGKLDGVYQETLKDFFLAVVFQRRTKGDSRRFQRAVLAAQVLVLCLVAAVVVFSARTAIPPLAPERAAVLQWLEENTDKPRIIRWHPPQPREDGQVRMRVEYHYVSEGGRGVDTDRVFILAGSQVVGEESFE